ncbi:MAG: (d)CMP kinase [Candidatus Omnitrophica bacterium]|nr:(d)CMP kinase [Candidatus Omnitrophota bacterium]
MNQKRKIITIDGPAGAGKSTIAKRLAKELNIFYLDTGAMYRAMTLKALKTGVDLMNEEKLVAMVKNSKLDIGLSKEGQTIILDGKDITGEIRTTEVTNSTKHVANWPRVRSIVVDWQRAIAKGQSIVMEGRDIGTVVFPDADYKFYLDADIKERSQRRLTELQEKGDVVDQRRLMADIVERDQKDMKRDASPLVKADDAILIDSTHLSIDEVIDRMLKIIKNG